MSKALDFTFDTADKQGLVLSEVVKKTKYTYLIFLRYFGCTSCQVDIAQLSAAYDKFTARDAQILVVLQSRPEILQQGIETRGIPFTIISDPEQKLYPLYKVAAAEGYEGMRLDMTPEQEAKSTAKREAAKELGFTHGEYEGNEYQLPAYFLIDREMNLLKEHWAQNMGDMPTPEEYLEMIP